MNQGQEAQVLSGTAYTKTMTVESTVNQEWRGEITFKLPSINDRMKAGLKQAQMRAGMPPEMLDSFTNYIAEIVGTLSVVVIKAPGWWYRETSGPTNGVEPRLEEITDLDLLVKIWEEYVAFRDTFPDTRPAPPNSPAATQSDDLASGQNLGSQSVQS